MGEGTATSQTQINFQRREGQRVWTRRQTALMCERPKRNQAAWAGLGRKKVASTLSVGARPDIVFPAVLIERPVPGALSFFLACNIFCPCGFATYCHQRVGPRSAQAPGLRVALHVALLRPADLGAPGGLKIRLDRHVTVARRLKICIAIVSYVLAA